MLWNAYVKEFHLLAALSLIRLDSGCQLDRADRYLLLSDDAQAHVRTNALDIHTLDFVKHTTSNTRSGTDDSRRCPYVNVLRLKLPHHIIYSRQLLLYTT